MNNTLTIIKQNATDFTLDAVAFFAMFSDIETVLKWIPAILAGIVFVITLYIKRKQRKVTELELKKVQMEIELLERQKKK